jgi:uncharacterized membrane protein
VVLENKPDGSQNKDGGFRKLIATESHKRSALKAISWRILAVIITTVTAYFFTKEVALSLGIGFVDAAIKIFTYYGHERMWNRIDFGRGKEIKEDYTI